MAKNLSMLWNWCKKEAVLTIAMMLAVISAFFVRPDKEYIGYIDFRTLAILFCLMAVMAGLQQIGLFQYVAEKLLKRVKHIRGIVCILVMLCFFSSMLITNDVALITFVPFAITVLKMAGLEKRMIPVVVLQTVAANIDASHEAEVRVAVSERLEAVTSTAAKLYYKGRPTIIRNKNSLFGGEILAVE